MARRAEEDARSEKAGRIVGAGMRPSTSWAGTREDFLDADKTIQ